MEITGDTRAARRGGLLKGRRAADPVTELAGDDAEDAADVRHQSEKTIKPS